MSDVNRLEYESTLRAAYEIAKERARKGDWRLYWEIQWPHVKLDWFQERALDGVFSKGVREVFQKGCTGCGKTASIAMATVANFDIWDEVKFVLTSSSSGHAQRVMFSEISRWWNQARIAPNGELRAASIYRSEQHRLDIVNPTSEETFSGGHGERTCFVMDECSAIPEGMFRMADTQAWKIWGQLNPRTMFGYARDVFPEDNPDETQEFATNNGRRLCITIPMETCLNVKEKRLKAPVAPIGGIFIDGELYEQGEDIPDHHFEMVKLLIPRQVDYGRYMDLKRRPDRWWVRVMVDAKFPLTDPEKVVVNREWLPRHCEYHTELQASGKFKPPLCFGLDCGGSAEGDPSVLTAMNEEGVVDDQFEQQLGTAPGVSSWVISTIRGQYGIELTHGDHPICIDMDGLGWGVGTDLAEQGCWVVEFRGNARSDVDSTLYGNKRAEGYGEVGKRLDWSQNQEIPFAVPDNLLLKEELVVPQKEFMGNDGRKFRITPKRNPDADRPSVTKILAGAGRGRSPDRGDSFVYAHTALRELQAGGFGMGQLDPTGMEVDDSWLKDIPEWNPEITEEMPF